VILCGRKSDPLQSTSRQIREKGGEVLALPTDIKEWAQVRSTVDVVLNRYGRIDALINNAGVAIRKAIMETDDEDWDLVLQTNLKGYFLCCKAVLPSMIEAHRGLIVNVSSILGLSGTAEMGAYCSSKFGVIGLTQSLAAELEQTGIKVCAVCPGPTYTDLHRQMVGEDEAKEAMSPERVAETILAVVTGKMELPSGEALVVDDQPKYHTDHLVERQPRLLIWRWLTAAVSGHKKTKD
jgi:NAD(P)-dependent dehydrogenase (short-subunit alcohol dehydrogenase family)